MTFSTIIDAVLPDETRTTHRPERIIKPKNIDGVAPFYFDGLCRFAKYSVTILGLNFVYWCTDAYLAGDSFEGKPNCLTRKLLVFTGP